MIHEKNQQKIESEREDYLNKQREKVEMQNSAASMFKKGVEISEKQQKMLFVVSKKKEMEDGFEESEQKVSSSLEIFRFMLQKNKERLLEQKREKFVIGQNLQQQSGMVGYMSMRYSRNKKTR